MKSFKLFLSVLAATMVMTSSAKSSKAQITRNYDVTAFQTIDMKGVGGIIFTQGDSFAVRAEGDSVLISRTEIKVEDGSLKISQKKDTKNKKSITIYITAPSLVKVEFEGVGTFKSKQPVVFTDEFNFQSEGVGSIEISDLTCKTLHFEQEGVGSSSLNVKCETASIKSEGIGSCTLTIEADTLKAWNEGVGSMKIQGHVKKYKHHSGGITSKISDKGLLVDER